MGLLSLKRGPRRRGEGERNTFGLPDGKPIRAELRRWFRRQLKFMLGTVAEIGVAVPDRFPALTDYDDPMAAAMSPILGAYWDDAGKALRSRVGLDPDRWQVTDPNLRAMIDTAAYDFCAATNATTTMALGDALAVLRRELAEGQVERGDTLDQLTKRVKRVFSEAETYRARRIAVTEAARAVHAAELQSAIESEVVVGFKWLLSDDACPLCQRIADEVGAVRLGQAFASVGDHPTYSTIRHPPAHPGCQCSVTEVLMPQYGGPANPAWGATINA